jgi:serine/threonine protein kinase
VRDQSSRKLFALKAITKSWNITRREVDHIRMERDILATLSDIHHPFLVRLLSAFQDCQNLYLLLDYHAGADLATLLQRYICFPAEQCRLYTAEIVMGLQELHRHCILYRDLKPENVLLASDGHVVLTDFGLSKMFDSNDDKYEHRTTTFCGTPEYLAPEIILQEEEYSYAADFWSLGTMLYEMLTGVTPFAAPTPEEMYDRVLYDDLLFPAKFDPEAMDLIAGLLERDPLNRLGAGFGGVFELRTHAYFSGHLKWKDVHAKRIQPMYVPLRTSETDLSNFDPDFLNMSTHIKEETDEAIILRQRWLPDSCPAGLSENAFRGYSYIEANDTCDIPYESELSFFSSEYMLYNEDDDLDDDYTHAASANNGDYSLTEQYYYQHDNNSNPPPFLHQQSASISSSSSVGVIQKRPLTKSSNPSMMMNSASFNFNQNIRNSLVINSSVKDDEVSAWRS